MDNGEQPARRGVARVGDRQYSSVEHQHGGRCSPAPSAMTELSPRASSWHVDDHISNDMIVPVYIAEIAPKNMRGALGSVNQLSVTIGILLAYTLGMFVPWRILSLLGKIDKLVAGKNGKDGGGQPYDLLRSNTRDIVFLLLLIGIGLLILQQLSGVNGIFFYAASIFKAAGSSYRSTEP
ncbi:hypothetical protein ZWY2020_040393 [Hordeum vulgare]|nr:hypothetical protein ZWY2020_040393 [Hordeum vulgare]